MSAADTVGGVVDFGMIAVDGADLYWVEGRPSEGGRQVLVRRWLGDRGAIRLDGVREPGTLWLVLRIPPADPANERLELEGEANLPGVLVRGCGGFEMSVSGPGTHEIQVPVEAAENGACRIGVNPNFSIVTTTTGKRRSVSLENAAWQAGARKAEEPPAAPAAQKAKSNHTAGTATAGGPRASAICAASRPALHARRMRCGGAPRACARLVSAPATSTPASMPNV